MSGDGAAASPDAPVQYDRTLEWVAQLVGFVAFVAFVSLAVQYAGLFGEGGIQPIDATLKRLAAALPSTSDRGWRAPSLFWLYWSPSVGPWAIVVGLAASLAATVRLLPGLMLLVAWGIYLSFVTVGSPYLLYQWDTLLLESLLLVGVLARWSTWSAWEKKPTLAYPAVLLIRLLVVRIYVASAFLKWGSQDPVWREFRALAYHFWTQPLPGPLSWYADQLPAGLLQAGVVFMFAAQGIFVWLILLTPTLRLIGFWAIVVLQAGILLTGNYGFFNLLTIALAFAALDDAQRAALFRGPYTAIDRPPAGLIRGGIGWVLAVAVAIAGVIPTLQRVGQAEHVPTALVERVDRVGAFRSLNAYGLFVRMTVRRDELTIEATHDGVTWEPYVFAYKPGPLDRRPALAGPHMPRLDWQMWFGALQPDCRRASWFFDVAQALLNARPDVLELFDTVPGDGRPPLQIRVVTQPYHFATATERDSGLWWQAHERSVWCPALQLGEDGRVRYAPR